MAYSSAIYNVHHMIWSRFITWLSLYLLHSYYPMQSTRNWWTIYRKIINVYPSFIALWNAPFEISLVPIVLFSWSITYPLVRFLSLLWNLKIFDNLLKSPTNFYGAIAVSIPWNIQELTICYGSFVFSTPFQKNFCSPVLSYANAPICLFEVLLDSKETRCTAFVQEHFRFGCT